MIRLLANTIMKPFISLLALVALVSAETTDSQYEEGGKKGGGKKGGKKRGKKGGKKGEYPLTFLTVTNESYNQPFSGVFVMVHNEKAEPLYVHGKQSSEALARLAEHGDNSQLVEHYTKNDIGVSSVEVFTTGAPFFGGDVFQIEVETSIEFPLVTIATMAINTNDCFIALNGVFPHPGLVIDLPGMDSGSEENNENCSSIPGPGCADVDGGNVDSGNGEGFVHVHRGVHGIGDLAAAEYDWRNPMMTVVISGAADQKK
jgi:hypothetical protein